MTLAGLKCSDIRTTPEYGERMTFGAVRRLLQTGLGSSPASFRGGHHFAGLMFARALSSKAPKKRYHTLFF